MKIAVIGGGSLYTAELARGFLARGDILPLSEIALVDIPEGADRMAAVSGLVGRMFAAAGLSVRVTSGFDPNVAIDGASFVLNQFRAGGLAGRSMDEKIPLRHGVVGQETTGPGGFAMALRSIPIALDMAERVQKLAPLAWVLNFTNPAGLVTEALVRHAPKVRTIGLCNIPLIFKRGVAKALSVPAEQIELSMIGLNHLSFARVFLGGKEITPLILASDLGVKELVANIPGLDPSDPAVQAMVRLMRRIGRIPNPYLRYYLMPQAMLSEEVRTLAAGEGTRADQVMRLEAELLARYREPDRTEVPAELAQRGGAWYSEAAVEVIEALITGQRAVLVVNTRNDGATPSLPPDSVIEVDAAVGADAVSPLAHGVLPPEIAGLVGAVKAYEQLTIEAAVTGERDTALAALAAHPLVPDVGTAVGLLQDLLEAHRPFVHPGFFGRADA